MVNDLVDNVYVMNLDRQLSKYNTVKKKLDAKNIQHQRFAGIDGYDGDLSSKIRIKSFIKFASDYSDSDFLERIMFRGGETLVKRSGASRSSGAMGCLLSTRNIIQDAIDNRYKKIIIFQDDIYFHKEFDKRIERLLPVIESSVVVHLGASEYNDFVKKHKWCDPNWNYDRFKYSTTEQTFGMWAVVIGEEMFAPFMEMSEFKFFAADQTLAFLCFNKFFGSSWVAYPNLVIADLNRSTTRADGAYPRSMEPKGEWVTRFGWDIDFYDLEDQYY